MTCTLFFLCINVVSCHIDIYIYYFLEHVNFEFFSHFENVKHNEFVYTRE